MGFVQGGDLEEMAAPVDYLGVNYYTRVILRSSAVSERDNEPVTLQAGEEKTDMGWEVYPEGLHEALFRLHFEYRTQPTISPRMESPLPISWQPTTRFTIQHEFPISKGTLPRQPGLSRPVYRCAGILSGRCWITSSGPRGFQSASV